MSLKFESPLYKVYEVSPRSLSEHAAASHLRVTDLATSVAFADLPVLSLLGKQRGNRQVLTTQAPWGSAHPPSYISPTPQAPRASLRKATADDAAFSMQPGYHTQQPIIVDEDIGSPDALDIRLQAEAAQGDGGGLRRVESPLGLPHMSAFKAQPSSLQGFAFLTETESEVSGFAKAPCANPKLEVGWDSRALHRWITKRSDD